MPPIFFARICDVTGFFEYFFMVPGQAKEKNVNGVRQAGNSQGITKAAVLFLFSLFFFFIHHSTPPGKKSLYPWITLPLYPTITLTGTRRTGDAFDQISHSQTAVVVFEFLFCLACSEDLSNKPTQGQNSGEQKKSAGRIYKTVALRRLFTGRA